MDKLTSPASSRLDPNHLSATALSRPRRVRGFQIPVSERRVLLVVGDLVAIEFSVLIALALWALRAQYHYDVGFLLSQLGWFIVLPVLWLVLALVNDYYDLRVAAQVGLSLRRLALIECEVLAIYAAKFFLSTPGTLPRRFMVYYAIMSLVLIGLWRAARIFLIGWTGFQRRALVVGNGHEAEVIWQALKHEAAGDYQLVGVCASERDLPSQSQAMPYLGVAADLPHLVATLGVTELVVAYAADLPSDVFKGLMVCYEQGAQVTPMARLYEQVTGRVLIEHLSDELWTLALRGEAHSLGLRLYAMWKRISDVALALVGLALFLPILPIVALAIALESRGPIFYSQIRLGKAGHPFHLFKLRSMRPDAEKASGARWTATNDPRVTRVGWFLRRTRLDEVPQLVNVLRGEMSLIGPRPERPEFVDSLAVDIPYYRARLAVNPGLTGWAQVRFRYGNSREDALRKLQYDLYYIRHQSPLLDALIAVKTIGVMLTFRGL